MLFVELPIMKSSERLKSYNHGLYRSNSHLLKALFKGECILCNKVSNTIEIHHNDRNRNNHDLNNLAHVCRNCHQQIHLTNFRFDNLKELLVKKLKFMVKCIEVGQKA